jgi:tetratricopeptide (TPR) repeat protein
MIGKLAGMSRRDAQQLIREQGGIAVDEPSDDVQVVVLGEAELPPAPTEWDRHFDEAIREAIDAGRIEVITETQLWQRLGLVDLEQNVRRLYTPAMLSELLGVPLAVVRRWHRRGLIMPVREVRRLPYFDFQEIATARRLAELLAAGMSPQTIEKKLAELARYLPKIDRPLAQLSVIVEGKNLLLRQGDGLVAPGGQTWFDFQRTEQEAAQADSVPEVSDVSLAESPDVVARSPDVTARSGDVVARTGDVVARSPDHAAATGDLRSGPVARSGDRATTHDRATSGRDEPQAILSIAPALFARATASVSDLVERAARLEEESDLEAAADMYRTAMAIGGPDPSACFALAELLYRLGDVTAARERYFMTIELDEEYVEARANLGCVLAELGQRELAVAAFEGALTFHDEYPDVHYHLAHALDDLDRPAEAEVHWRAFLSLAPESPWAATARQRLSHLAD